MTIFAKATVSSNRVLGTVDDMIYGQYLEHVQPEHHCIYGAIVDEPSALTDEHGFRLDVIDAVRDLGVPVVRWPGGCFADIYHWEDGVGPKELRPARRNWHWGGIEPNTFGTDEFLGWAERIGALPYLNFNLGTGTLDEAIRWLDYCNGSELTADVLNRQANGRVEPWNVRFWGVGNEQWGPWEANSLDAETYAERLRNWTQFFRKLDPAAEFMGIASHSARDPEWDLTVLLKSGHLIDWITLHAYGHSIHDGTGNDYYPTVTFPVFFEERLIRLIALIESASARIGRTSPIRIALDEWNIRHLRIDSDTGASTLDRLSPRTLQDCVAAAGVFNAMIRHPDQVGMANYVFLLNGNGVLLVNPDGIVKTPLYHLFSIYQRALIGTSVETSLDCEPIDVLVRSEQIGSERVQSVSPIDVVTTIRDGVRAHAIVNRHLSEEAAITIVDHDAPSRQRARVQRLTHADPLIANTFDCPDAILPLVTDMDWTGVIRAPPHSVAIVERFD